MIKVQGVRGELINNELYYLDDKNEGQYQKIVTDVNATHTKDTNPNLSIVREIEKIMCGENVLYEPELGMRGLSEDETAIAGLMIGTAKYSRGEAESPYSMEDAFADAYAAILLDEAVRTGNKISSCIENNR